MSASHNLLCAGQFLNLHSDWKYHHILCTRYFHSGGHWLTVIQHLNWTDKNTTVGFELWKSDINSSVCLEACLSLQNHRCHNEGYDVVTLVL